MKSAASAFKIVINRLRCYGSKVSATMLKLAYGKEVANRLERRLRRSADLYDA